MRTLYDIARDTPCAQCGALVSKDCKTSAGFSSGTHTVRMTPIHEAYAQGYDQCEKDMSGLKPA